jgi:hypothetical protein
MCNHTACPFLQFATSEFSEGALAASDRDLEDWSCPMALLSALQCENPAQMAQSILWRITKETVFRPPEVQNELVTPIITRKLPAKIKRRFHAFQP